MSDDGTTGGYGDGGSGGNIGAGKVGFGSGDTQGNQGLGGSGGFGAATSPGSQASQPGGSNSMNSSGANVGGGLGGLGSGVASLGSQIGSFLGGMGPDLGSFFGGMLGNLLGGQQPTVAPSMPGMSPVPSVNPVAPTQAAQQPTNPMTPVAPASTVPGYALPTTPSMTPVSPPVSSQSLPPGIDPASIPSATPAELQHGVFQTPSDLSYAALKGPVDAAAAADAAYNANPPNLGYPDTGPGQLPDLSPQPTVPGFAPGEVPTPPANVPLPPERPTDLGLTTQQQAAQTLSGLPSVLGGLFGQPAPAPPTEGFQPPADAPLPPARPTSFTEPGFAPGEVPTPPADVPAQTFGDITSIPDAAYSDRNKYANWRNHNPGDIRDGSFAQAQPGYVGAVNGFAQFANDASGFAAMNKNLDSYAAKGYDTPAKMLNRWSPPSENQTSALVSNFAARTGMDPNVPMSNDPATRAAVMHAIATQEGSAGPYSSGQIASMMSGVPAGGAGLSAGAMTRAQATVPAADMPARNATADAQEGLPGGLTQTQAFGSPSPVAGEGGVTTQTSLGPTTTFGGAAPPLLPPIPATNSLSSVFNSGLSTLGLPPLPSGNSLSSIFGGTQPGGTYPAPAGLPPLPASNSLSSFFTSGQSSSLAPLPPPVTVVAPQGVPPLPPTNSLSSLFSPPAQMSSEASRGGGEVPQVPLDTEGTDGLRPLNIPVHTKDSIDRVGGGISEGFGSDPLIDKPTADATVGDEAASQAAGGGAIGSALLRAPGAIAGGASALIPALLQHLGVISPDSADALQRDMGGMVESEMGRAGEAGHAPDTTSAFPTERVPKVVGPEVPLSASEKVAAGVGRTEPRMDTEVPRGDGTAPEVPPQTREPPKEGPTIEGKDAPEHPHDNVEEVLTAQAELARQAAEAGQAGDVHTMRGLKNQINTLYNRLTPDERLELQRRYHERTARPGASDTARTVGSESSSDPVRREPTFKENEPSPESMSKAAELLGEPKSVGAAASPALNLPDRPSKAAVEDLADDLHRVGTRAVGNLIDLSKKTDELPEHLKNPVIDEKYYRYEEGDPSVKLTPEEKADYDKYHGPMKQREHDNDVFIRRFGYDVGNVGDAPDPNYVRRMVKGRNPEFDRLQGQPGADPIGGGSKRSLSKNVSSAHERVYHVLEDAQGNRQVVALNNGKLNAVDKASTPLKAKVNQAWARSELAKITTDEDKKAWGKKFGTPTAGATVDAGGKTWKMVPARTSEIEAATKAAGRPVEYYKSAWANKINNIANQERAIEGIKTFERFKNSPEFDKYFKPYGSKDAPRTWIVSKLPQLHNFVGDPKLVHAFDDFVGHEPFLGEGMAKVNRWIVGSLFWNPVAHGLNTTSHWHSARGWDWLTPRGWHDLAVYGTQAIREVATQGPKLQELMKEGNSLMYPGVAQGKFYEDMAKKFGQEIVKDPKRWGPIAEKLSFTGVNKIADLSASMMDGSRRILWAWSDVLMMQRVLENEAKGMPLRRAIKETEKHIPPYRVPSEVMGSRLMSRIMQDSSVSNFSPYHYGMWKAYSNMVHDIVKPLSPLERQEAVGNLMATGFQLMVAAPLLDMALQHFTDKEEDRKAHADRGVPGRIIDNLKGTDPGAHFTTHGALTIPRRMLDIAEGNKDLAAIVTESIVPAPLPHTIAEELLNRNTFTGKHIREPADMDALRGGDWRSGLSVLGQEAGHISKLFAPVGQIEKITKDGAQGVSEGLAGELLGGVKDPTDAQMAGKKIGQRNDIRSAAWRRALPKSLPEQGMQWLENLGR